MTQTLINIGTSANDGTGDTIRGAFANTNNNFTEVYHVATYGSDTSNGAFGVANTGNVRSSYSAAHSNNAYYNANLAFDLANTANQKATVNGPYDTDYEAGVNGISIGGLYYRSTGNVHVRLA